MLDKFNLSLTIISTRWFYNIEFNFNEFDKIIISILFILSSFNIFLILGLLKINNTYNFHEDKYFIFSFILFFYYG